MKRDGERKGERQRGSGKCSAEEAQVAASNVSFTSRNVATCARGCKRGGELQGNVPALLKLGDSAWYGRGAPRDWHRAAQLYAYAAKLRDAQASFNLGFMHQFGVGLPQDLALAKRYYDKAGEVKADAWLPVSLALYALAVHSWCVPAAAACSDSACSATCPCVVVLRTDTVACLIFKPCKQRVFHKASWNLLLPILPPDRLPAWRTTSFADSFCSSFFISLFSFLVGESWNALGGCPSLPPCLAH